MEGKDGFFDYAIEQLRLQRHDFMNYLQVIFGYIQINKPNDAISYIKEINKKMIVLSKVFNLECNELSILLQDFLAQCSKYSIDVVFYTELEYISSGIFSKNIDDNRKIFTQISSIFGNELRMSGNDKGKIYMSINEGQNGIDIMISNTQEYLEQVEDDRNDILLQKSEMHSREGLNVYLYKDNGSTAVKLRYKEY